jgi:hypothetical protein
LRGKKYNYDDYHKITDNQLLKKCIICNEWIPCNDEFFYKNKGNKSDGLYPECKECSKKKAAQWVKDNYSRHKKLHKKYRATDKYKKWNRKNHIKMQDKIKEWMLINKDKVNQYSKIHRQKDHRISEKEWDLCKFYFNHRCAYCGLSIEEHYVKRKGKLQWQDFHKEHVIHDGRIDIKNCVPSCQSCNSSKHTASLNNWYNSKNLNYTYERYYKIYQWLRYDYKKYITKRKPKQKYERKIK